MIKLFSKIAAVLFAVSFSGQQALAVTTGLDFAGGCTGNDADKGTLCANNGQASEANVAAILGVDPSLVTEVFQADMNGGPYVDGIGALTGTWSIGSTNATHIAFKADGYYILAEVTANSGDFMMADPVTTWGTDVSLPCPAPSICLSGPRPYVDADFLNDGGNVAELSNVRGYYVVPVPAAVWLFGSGLLGLVGIARRKHS